MAAKRHGAGGVARLPPARPRPVPRQISQARAIRWLSSARRLGGGGGIGLAQAGVQCGGADPRSSRAASVRASGPGSGISAMPSVSEAKYSPIRRSGSAADQPARAPSTRAPSPATRRRCRPRRRDGCHTGGERGSSSSGVGRAVRPEVRDTPSASVLMIVPLKCCAISSARADFPLAVGPATISAVGVTDCDAKGFAAGRRL